MLCSLKTHRPDKLLQKHLLQLAYSLIALAAAIILFMVYPEYYLYLILSMLILCIFCLALTIKTLRAGEEAISYDLRRFCQRNHQKRLQSPPD